ncbi:hypothetical protein HYH02_009066 [Chlamydomonas schloesseri]|uniref:Guanylate cyclase domain-containing protein n=1 Tax=Chlamydomonas schloesseri TaxID=2026947 RepID=A0A836B0K1_9CHLO|nr:hypothetical protein HYH02_009066 [Chlamydomonas schloesseri]|eukprot:KAG2444126.1 hypothetical protein HYH02_009066 [Chlamydomonas schloesseri]
MAILPAVSYSCRDRATRGLPPVANGSANALLYSQSTRTLLGGFFQYCTSVGLKRPLYYLLPPTSLSAVLVAAADSMAAPFASFPGDRLQKNFTRVASLDALEEALLGYVSARRARMPDGLPYGYDSVITPYSGLQELRAAGLLTGLAGISSLDTLYQRGDIHPALLDTVSYAGELAAVPLDGSQLLLYVRKDVLAAAAAMAAAGGSSSGGSTSGGSGLGVPDSWEQLLALAAAVNGSAAAQLRPAVNATGGVTYAAATGPVFGFCMQPHTHMVGALALAVLASLVQTHGSEQGMYLNADTLRPAATTAAMPYVLSYLRRLAAYSAPVAFSARAPQFSNDFALGRCAMTVGTAAQFRRNSHTAHPAGPSAVIGKVTAALLPGTSTGQAAASTSSQALVNRAPLMSPGGAVGGVYGNNAEVMPQLYTWTMLSALGGPVNSWQLLLLPVSELGPWRLSHMDPADSALGRWRAAGYSTADVASFLTAARATLDHPNIVLPLRVRTAIMHVRAVRTAALRVLNATAATPWVLQPAVASSSGGDGSGAGGTSSSTGGSNGRRAVLQALAADAAAAQQQGVLTELMDSMAALYGYGPGGAIGSGSGGAGNGSGADLPTREQMMQEYRRSLGLSYSPPTTTSGAAVSDSDGGSNLPVGAVVGAVVGGVLVAALAGIVACRAMSNRGRRRGRWRVVEPPVASPDTVLLVTDIEGSTSLWEALPEEVMDRALRTHHITVRTVGIFYNAYESATVSDSFILAFATATDAAQFALGLQRALLAARWPQELLAVPACAPVYVRKLDWLAKANQVSLAPAPPRRLAARPVRARTRATDASGGGVHKGLRFPSRNIASVLGAFAGHSRAKPYLQHAATSKRSAFGAQAAEAAAGAQLTPAPGGFGRAGSAHAPSLLSRRWTSRRTSNDQAAIAAALGARDAATQGEGQGVAALEDVGLGPTAEEAELDAEVAAAVEAAAAAAGDVSQHGRAGGGAAAGNRHLLGRFWAAMDAGGRPMQQATSMRRRRRRSDTSLVAVMAAPYLERQSVPGHGQAHVEGSGARTPGGNGTGTGIGPGAAGDGTRSRSLLKFAMHGRQSLNVRGSPDLRLWSPGAGGGGPLGGTSSLPVSPAEDNPDGSMYGGRGTPGAGDGGRRARRKSSRHASVTFAAIAAAAIAGSKSHDAGVGSGGANSGSLNRPGRMRRASLAISNLLGLGSGAASGPASGGLGSAGSAAATDAAVGLEGGVTPRQLSRQARRGSMLNILLGSVAGLASPTGTGTDAAGTTDGGLTFTGNTGAGVETLAGDAATGGAHMGGSGAPPAAAASGSPHSHRLRRASLVLTSWLGLGQSRNTRSGSHVLVAAGAGSAPRPMHSRRASSDAVTEMTSSATVTATTTTGPAAPAAPASSTAAEKGASYDLAQPSPKGAGTNNFYTAAAPPGSPHQQVNGYSVVALSAALAASEYKVAAAAAVSGAVDRTQLTRSSCGLPELPNSEMAHASNCSGTRARLLAGRAVPSPGLPGPEEAPLDALAAAAAPSPAPMPEVPSPRNTGATSGAQPSFKQARSRRASSFVPRLLNLSMFEAATAAGAGGGGGGPPSTSGSGGGTGPRTVKSQGSNLRRRYSTVLERALSPRGKSTAGNSGAVAAATAGGGSGGDGLSDAAAPEMAAVPGVSTWGSELGVEDGAEKWAELKWQMSGRRTATADAPVLNSGATSGGGGPASGPTSRHSHMQAPQLTVAAAAGGRPKLDIARVFSIAHMQDGALPTAPRNSATNTGPAQLSGAASARGGGGTDGVDLGQGSPLALSGDASPLFPPGLPLDLQQGAADGPRSERRLAAPAAGLVLPVASEPQVRSCADFGELPTRRTAPDVPPNEHLLDMPLQHSQPQPHPHPLPRKQLQQGSTASGERTSLQERRSGPPPVNPAATCSPAPPSGAPSPMPPSQQSRTGASSAFASRGTADAAPGDERWSLAGVIIGSGGAGDRAASSGSHATGATLPVLSSEPAPPRVRDPAVPLSLLLPANSPPPGPGAGLLSSVVDESVHLDLRASVGNGADAGAGTASVPLPQRPARMFGPVLSPQPAVGLGGSASALRHPVATAGISALPLSLQMQREGASQVPASSPSASQLQQPQPVRSAAAGGPLARLLARPAPLLVSPRHASQLPSAASPGYPNLHSSATNPNTPTSTAAGALAGAPSSASAASAAAALHRRFSELAAELAKPPARAKSQAGSGGSPTIDQPDQVASPRRGGFSITAGGSSRSKVPFDRSRTFSNSGGESAGAGGSGGASDRGNRSLRSERPSGASAGSATAALAAVVAGALKFRSFSRRAASSGARAPLPRSHHAQHVLATLVGTSSAGGSSAAVQPPPDGTQSATLPHLSASAAAVTASQGSGSSRMARLEYTASRRRVGAALEPLERLEEETGSAAQTVPLPAPLPQSPGLTARRPLQRLRSSGAVGGISAAANDPTDQPPPAAAEAGPVTPKGGRVRSDGGGAGASESRPSRSSIVPSTLQMLLKRSGTGGSSRKAGAAGLLHFADPASTESADLLAGNDGSGRGQARKSPAQLLLVARSAELDVPSVASAHGLDLVDVESPACGANARASAGGGFGSAIVPLAEPPRAPSASAGELGGGADTAGFVKPTILIPMDTANASVALPQPFAHDQPALTAPRGATPAGISIANLAAAASNLAGGGVASNVLRSEPLPTVNLSGIARAGSIMTYAPAARVVKPPTHGSLLELLHRVFVRVDDEEEEGHTGLYGQQQQQQQRPPDMQLVFAGLRVRVGLHCGVTDARDIQYNAATARMTFGGEGLRIAKAVCDCASGGQVVMSGEVLLRLQLAGSGGVLLLQQQQMLLQGQTHVLDLGDHQLLEAVAARPHAPTNPEAASGGAAMTTHAHPAHPTAAASEPSVPVSRHLLCIAAPALLGRMVVIPPVRSALHQYTPGFMDAPVGPAVCVVVFRVSNAAALAAWNAAVASEAMALLELYLRASLGALINTSNTSGNSGTDPNNLNQTDTAGPLTGRGGVKNTANRLACYLAAAPPGSPFGTFVAGFSQPAAAARWALNTVSRTSELPWPAELLESQWGRPLEEVTRAEAEAADAAAAAGGGGGNILPYAIGSGAGTATNSPGGASSFPPGGGSPPRGGAFAALGGSVGSRMARLLRTAPVGWISSPLSLGSHKSSGRAAGDRGADSSPLVSGTVLLSLPPAVARGGGGAGVVVGGAVIATEMSSAALMETGGWAPVEVEDDVELGEPSTAGVELLDQPASQHSAMAAVGAAGGSGQLRGGVAPRAASSFGSASLALRAQLGQKGHAQGPSAVSAAAMTSWDAAGRGEAGLRPAAELDGGEDVPGMAPAAEPAGSSACTQGAHYHPNGAASAVSAPQLPPMPGGRSVGPAAVRSGGVGSPVRGLGMRSVLGGASSAGGSGVMRSGGSASRLPMPSRFALAAEAHDPAPPTAATSILARAAGPTLAAVSNTEIVVVMEQDQEQSGHRQPAGTAAAPSTVPTRFLRSAEVPSAMTPALPASRGFRLTHTSEHGAEGPPPAAMAAAGFASGLGLSGLPPGARRIPSATGLGAPVQRLRNRLLQHLTLSFTSLSRKVVGGSPVAAPRLVESAVGDTMDSQASGPETESAACSGAEGRTMSGPVQLHSPGDWPLAGTSGRAARGLAGAGAAATQTPRPALAAAGLPSGGESAVTGVGLEEAAATAAAAARAEEDAEVVSFRGLRVRLGMAVGPVRVELCPLTGRVVYSGKTVTTAMTSAASARLGTLLANQAVAEAIAEAQGGAGLMLQFPSGYHSSTRQNSARQDSTASHATAHTAAPATTASGPRRKAMFRRAQTAADEASAHTLAASDRRGGAAAATHAAAAPAQDSHGAADSCPTNAFAPMQQKQQLSAAPAGGMFGGFKRRSGAGGGAIQRARTSSMASPDHFAPEPAARHCNVPASSTSSQHNSGGSSTARPSPATAAEGHLGGWAAVGAATSAVAIPSTLPEADDELASGAEGAAGGGDGYDDAPWATGTEPGEARTNNGVVDGVGGDKADGACGAQANKESQQPEAQGPNSQPAAQLPQLLCTPAVGGGLGVAFGGGGGGGGLGVPRLNPKNPTFRVRLQPGPTQQPQYQRPLPSTDALAPAPEVAAIRHGT